MASIQERTRILEMLKEGQLTAEAAAHLLQALDDEPVQPYQVPASPEAPSAADVPSVRKPRWLRVRVTDTDSGRPRVNLRVPIALVNMGLKLGARYSPEVEGIDLQALVEAADKLEPGPFVDVYDDEDGEHVEIFLE